MPGRKAVVCCVLLFAVVMMIVIDVAEASKSPEIRKSRAQQRKELKEKRSEKQKQKERDDKAKRGAVDIAERGIVSEHLTAASILGEHDITNPDRESRNFKGDVLAYVTPWNNHGYDLVKWYRKFTYVAPVWYSIRTNSPANDGPPHLHGGHDVDQPWIQEVRGSGKMKPKIVPRFVFQVDAGYSPDNMALFLHTPYAQDDMRKLLVKECKDRGFDGVTLEVWAQAAAIIEQDDNKKKLVAFVNDLGKDLKKAKKELVLVVPAVMTGSDRFTVQDFFAMEKNVDRFSLVTYDFSPPGYRIGPNSPASWLTHVMGVMVGKNKHGSKKLLMGVPFYGYDHQEDPKGGTAVVGETVRQLIQRYQPEIEWDGNAKEHFFRYTTAAGANHVVYFVSPKMLDERLAIASEFGAGVAIWDVGQGMDWLMDVL